MNKKIIILIILFLMWYYPIQRYLALKDFNKYIKEQKISEFNIKEKTIYKSIKYDGYYIKVIYKDEPNLSYLYYWWINLKNVKYNISLSIYDDTKNKEIGFTNIIPKYPRLEL